MGYSVNNNDYVVYESSFLRLINVQQAEDCWHVSIGRSYSQSEYFVNIKSKISVALRLMSNKAMDNTSTKISIPIFLSGSRDFYYTNYL